MAFIKKYLAFALIIIIGYFPLVSMMMMGPKERLMHTERRLRVPKPKINIRKPSKTFKDFELYFNDNYGLRDMLVMLGCSIKVNIFGTSPSPLIYFMGKAGWKFYSATILESAETMDEYRGLQPLTKKELAETKKSFEQLDSLVKKNGGKLYTAFIPNKQSIYPEYLPAHYNRYMISKDNRRLNQFYRYMNSTCDVSLINLETELLQAKDTGQGLLYNPRTDYSHWNMRGAYIGYRAVLQKIQKDFPGIPSIDHADLAFETVEKLKTGDYPLFAGFFEWRDKELVPETVHFKRSLRKSGKRVLFLGDSFGRNIAPYFQASFNTVYFYRAKSFSPALIEELKPEIVIWFRSARYVGPIVMKKDSMTLPLSLKEALEF